MTTHHRMFDPATRCTAREPSPGQASPRRRPGPLAGVVSLVAIGLAGGLGLVHVMSSGAPGREQIIDPAAVSAGAVALLAMGALSLVPGLVPGRRRRPRRLGVRSTGATTGSRSPVPPPRRSEEPARAPRPRAGIVDAHEAVEFLRMFHEENPQRGPAQPRISLVLREIEETGTYRHTPEELTFGARVAWRNNARCIGRLYWRSLQVRDLRSVSDAAAVAGHCFEHLSTAFNGGRLRPVISIFAPEAPGRPAPRIWNEQLIRYAGYPRPEGGVLGDPRYTAFTQGMVERGWTPPTPRGPFDVLPLVVETAHEGPRLFDLPTSVVQEVELEHPDLDWFADLGLRWHAVPVISNTTLSIGGISYPAAPFNGWYMGTEIGARNLGDSERYDLVPVVAARMGLDTSIESSLWRDQALVEINRAVLHSFGKAGVAITDHHTESRRFLTHLEREERAGRSCPADWSWIVPPLSGSQTPVFHRYYDEEDRLPNFVADEEAVRRGLVGAPQAFADRSHEATAQ